LNAEIERYPGAKGFETTSIPKEEVEQLPPEMRQYYELRQALQKKNQAEAKQKKDAAKRAARFGL
jgi:RPA family protein